MTFYWVDDQGNVGYTNEGFSRVPSEFRGRTFLNQEGASNLSQQFSDYLAYGQQDRDLTELMYGDENNTQTNQGLPNFGYTEQGELDPNVSPMARMLGMQRGVQPTDYSFYNPVRRQEQQQLPDSLMSPSSFGQAPIDASYATDTNRFLESLTGVDTTMGNPAGAPPEGMRDGGALKNNSLNQGIGQLPERQQNDMLTQLYQTGFKPRR